MDGRRARLIAPVLDKVPTLRRVVPEPARHLSDQLEVAWAAALGLGWPVALAIGFVIEPTPAEPEAAGVPIVVQLAGLILQAAVLTTVVAAIGRSRVAAAAGVVVGLVAVTLSVACPTSGHHGFGLWWVAQLGLMVTMLGVSLAALRRQARSPL
jgi:hypothetical protein